MKMIGTTNVKRKKSDQNKLWGPMLLKAGFKVTVPEFLNSNSGNWVTVYHLVYDATKREGSNLPNPFNRSE
jgi:1,4-alpha-glucan branching enzyme